MKDTIYLILDRNGVKGLRKSLVDVKRGEVCAKFNITMPDTAFRPPVLEQNIAIDTWHNGIDIEDVKFEKNVITEAEAEVIRQNRLEKMAEILSSQGYTITKEESDDDTVQQ